MVPQTSAARLGPARRGCPDGLQPNGPRTPSEGFHRSARGNENDSRDEPVTTEWPDERIDRIRVAALEQELVKVTEELETTTRKLEAAQRQIGDLRRLFEVLKRSPPKWDPEISEYPRD